VNISRDKETRGQGDKGIRRRVSLFFCLLVSLSPCPLVPKTMTPELFDSGVPRSASDSLVKLFEAAQDKLKKIVLNPPGGTEASRMYRQAWAAQQIQQIDRMMVELRQGAASWIGANLPIAVRDGVLRAELQAEEAGVAWDAATRGQGDKAMASPGPLSPRPLVPLSSSAPPSGSFSLIDQGTVAAFATDIFTDLSGAATSMGERAQRLLRATAQNDLSEASINTILAGGVIEGRPAETIRTLREEFRRVAGDEIAVRTKTGGVMNFEVGYYASMVARTRTRQASVHSRHQRLQQLGLNLVSIIGLLSKNFCTAYLGQVYSLDGRSDKYPALSDLPGGGPPFHPNCSKSTRPFIEELASEKQLDMAEGDDDQAKMLNIDPATAQRRFKDLQIEQMVRKNYASTAKRLFGKTG
jgi:hypothetical protein